MMMYAIYSAIILTLLYGVFFAFLCQETFHRANRITLLAMMVLSLMLPILPHNWDFSFLEPLTSVEVLISKNPGTTTDGTSEISSVAGSWNWKARAGTIYWAGMILYLVVSLYRIVLLCLYMRQGLRQTDNEGNTIILKSASESPFSVLRYIVMSVEDYEQHKTPILLHEQEHIRQLHSLDLILLTVVQCIQWFNPFVWVLGRNLKVIHEYEADKAMLDNGVDIKDYQYLLVNKCNRSSAFALVNEFNHSQLISRIIMLNKKRSRPTAWARYLIFIPMLLLSYILTATPTETYVAGIEISESTGSEDIFMLKGIVVDASTEEPITGAVIILEGTTQGVCSSTDGIFQLEVMKGQKLKVLMIDYIESEVIIQDQKEIIIPLSGE